MREKKCGNCDAFVSDGANFKHGTCHASPPTVFPMTMSMPNPANLREPMHKVVFQGAFPPISVDNFCRQHVFPQDPAIAKEDEAIAREIGERTRAGMRMMLDFEPNVPSSAYLNPVKQADS